MEKMIQQLNRLVRNVLKINHIIIISILIISDTKSLLQLTSMSISNFLAHHSHKKRKKSFKKKYLLLLICYILISLSLMKTSVHLPG